MIKFYVIIFALFFVIGCGTSTSTDDQEVIVLDPYADPPGITGNPFAGFGEVSSINLPAPENESIVVEFNQVEVEDESWTVQIAACATENAAKSLRDTIAASTEYPVFIDQIGSYYKVRVGAFSSSAASDELRVNLRANGYPDAWSVKR